MKSFVLGMALIFGLLSTAPNFQGAQFLKLPELVKHYSEHQSGEESFSSFFSFLQEHYFSNHHEGKNEQHMPFKATGIGCCVAIINEKVCHPDIIWEYSASLKQTVRFGDPNGSLNDYNGSVWNPPQLI